MAIDAKQNLDAINRIMTQKNQEPTSPQRKDYYKCTCCGKVFYAITDMVTSRSQLFKGTNGATFMCKECADLYYNRMKMFYHDDDKLALEHCCRMFDWYYNTDIFKETEAALRGDKSHSMLSLYALKKETQPNRKKGRTYEDTLQERYAGVVVEGGYIEKPVPGGLEGEVELEKTDVDQETIDFFGTGFTNEEYLFLAQQYEEWTTRYECQTKALEELFKQLSITQVMARRAQFKGDTKTYNDTMKAFQDLLGSSNLKPNQSNENALAEQNTFGTLIKRWENEKPIPEPAPEWRDVDGIANYIDTYYTGHMCNLLHVNNDKEQMYLEAMERNTVQPPVYEDDETEVSDTSVLDKYSNRGGFDNADE